MSGSNDQIVLKRVQEIEGQYPVTIAIDSVEELSINRYVALASNAAGVTMVAMFSVSSNPAPEVMFLLDSDFSKLMGWGEKHHF